MTLRVGIDTGGTFTDLVALDEESRRLWIGKRPSTPASPADGIFDAFAAAGLEPDRAGSVVLGTTIATNALLERSGARVLYVTTSGFEDIPTIQRVDKKDPYDLQWLKARPLVARGDCLGVAERIDFAGAVVEPLRPEELERLAEDIRRRLGKSEGAAVAVNLLFSFANPEHERAVAAFLRERFQELPISCSHEVAPVWREYERASTVIIDAYLKPVLSRLIDTFAAGLEARGSRAAVSVMKSNGGQILAAVADEEPVQTVLSGLSGGIVAGRYFGERAGEVNMITLDMGGTSADIGLVRRGLIHYVPDFELEFGLPIATPAIDLVTIGAGGGSIAWIDEGGLLRVGPHSAGAVPGPVCYGLGGEAVTVTDANVVLGRIDPEYFLGGRIRLDRDLAERRLGELGARFGMTAVGAAQAILEIANEGMSGAIRRTAVERGVDPRDFALVAFGGAGPLHAGDVAAALGMRTVVVPPRPALASAFGTLVADRRVDRRWTKHSRSDAIDLEAINARLDAMAVEAVAGLRHEGFAAVPEVIRSVSMRYAGQNYERDVPLLPGPLDDGALAAVIDAFHEQHRAAYGYAFPGEAVELIHLNVTALGASEPPELPGPGPGVLPEPDTFREVYLDPGRPALTPIYRRESLPGSCAIDGPAIVEEPDSTTLVLPGQTLEVLDGGSLRISLEGGVRHGRRSEVDAVTLSVVGDQLVSIATEMGSHMMRSSYSPIFSESRDFSCALFDRSGEMIAQGPFSPAHLGAIVETVRCVLEELGVGAFEPGDVVLHNDPYRGGCHMPEHMLLGPVFHGGELVAFAATIGHLAEIGATAVGSFASDATEVFQEGLRLPPVKLMRRGERVEDVWKIILSNHRTPKNTWGDLYAMIGSLRLAERRIVELLDRYGPDVALRAWHELKSHAERLMRHQIEAIPDGEYSFGDSMEDDGITDSPARFRATIVVRGDRAVVDYTGSDQQARGPVNATFGVAVSATYNAFLQISGAEMPRNAGAYRCLKTIAPLGSVVNVRFPGPSVGGNTETQPKLVGLLLGAFAEVLPERVMAAEGVTSCNFLFGGIDPRTGDPYAHYHFEASGWGGRFARDGNSAQNHIHGNCRNTPVEVFETRFPFRVLSYGLVPDSGGAGRHRGGLGTERILEVLAPEVTVSAMMDRVKEGAWGLFGGRPGGCAAILVRRPGEAAFRTFCEAFGTVSPSKFAGLRLLRGDRILIRSAGGGGYGDPREREPSLVRRDLEEGLVTEQAACAVYGVAVR